MNHRAAHENDSADPSCADLNQSACLPFRELSAAFYACKAPGFCLLGQLTGQHHV